MSGPIPKVGVGWYHAQTEVDVVVCLSTVEHWISHFDPGIGRSVRCGGDSCGYCLKGWTQQLRVVVGVQSPRQGKVLLELRERHRGVFEVLEVGSKIRIVKLGSAKNAPVQVDLAGKKEVEEWSICNLVGNLGLQTHLRKSDQTTEGGEMSATA